MESLRVYIELILFLVKENGCKSTSEIRKFLENSGLIDGSYHNKRRKLLNYLYNLESLGYVERCSNLSKRDVQWKINKTSSLLNLISISEEEKTSLLLTLSFIPRFYKNLKFYKDLKSVLEKTSENISAELERIINNAFTYLPHFFQKSYYSHNLLHTLENITKDIIDQRFVKVLYKGEHKKILPLRIIFYEGVFYLSGLEINPDKSYTYRLYRLSCLKRLAPLEKSQLFVFHQKKAFSTFKFEDEMPFPFAIEVPNYYIKCDEEADNKHSFLIFQTQFGMEILENGNLKIYLVGFTSKRFYSHLSQLEIKKVYRPDSKMITLLKDALKNNRDRYNDNLDDDRLADLLRISVNTARQRFDIFKEKFRRFLEEKIVAVDSSG